MNKPVAGGTPRVVLQGKGISNFQCAMAPSTLCLFSQIDEREGAFRLFDLEHGAGRELLKLPYQIWSDNVNWSLSPDGLKLAKFLDHHGIQFFNTATGAAYDVTVKDWPIFNGDWGANSQTIFMPSCSQDGIPVILEVDQTGKARVVLKGRENTDHYCLIQSPDGRHAIVVQVNPIDSNAWILNDF
jgi:hypothetical protein